MNRAFISLYVIIVAAILIVGWGMDKLWQAYNPEPQTSSFESAFLFLLEERLSPLRGEQLSAEIDRLNQSVNLQLSLYSLDELAKSTLAEKIVQGDVVSMFDEDGARLLYKNIEGTDFVLAARQKEALSRQSNLYSIFIFVFYLCLAIVVYFWVWPLSRDLRILEKHTVNIGKTGSTEKVVLRTGSNVQHLADAFNKMAERIQELLLSRKEMTYAVSHELRTPLARMKFALEILGENAESESIKEKLMGVREDVAALDKFVSELLSYASFDEGETQLQLSTGNFYSMCQSLVESLEEGMANQSVTIKIHVNNQSEYQAVSCDWLLMERVMSNLLENALRYAQSRIHISLDSDSSHFNVTVEDDGPGIPEEERERVFQSFVRLSGNAVEKRKGYGLGLAIVKRILYWHRGKVGVEQSALGGAKFILQWPNQEL